VRILVALAAALLTFSCARHDIDNKEAVRKGVVDYLEKRKSQTGLDMGLMNLEVTNVSFEKNEARATVAFRPKDGRAGSMSMNYVLERKGDQWVVKGRQESGLNPHGGAATPGAMGSPAPGDLPSMPLNHPPTAPPPSPAGK
jgi:hypothetical protein